MPTNDLEKLKKWCPELYQIMFGSDNRFWMFSKRAGANYEREVIESIATRLLLMGDVIEKYADHNMTCDSRFALNVKCTCGYDDAIAKLKGE